ncbi:nucleotidyltransferase family protein [Geothrix sp. PMB-07]|uniref:nucleotidyltransferase family protein n=1 Tax=Geothrix sp. PMB-07 TaxID=3068640 RepID=UPI0027419D27|nr:nucleotidyltransferase family protein [Geothrix sp. PMB-07]WLT33293.1 nucleotidyltransferase family protein [Geothrix sp. PMB-07]
MNPPSSIAAIILAAGSGRRMGGPKALLRLEGETLLRRAVRAALEAGCAPVIAVVGDWDPGLSGLPVQAIPNPGAAEGMASSIRAGLAALPAEAEGVLLLTVDQPAVDTVLLKRLMALAGEAPMHPAACAYAGTLGVPALLPRRLFPELAALEGDRGAKAILQREQALTLPFPEGERDLDTPADIKRLKR